MTLRRSRFHSSTFTFLLVQFLAQAHEYRPTNNWPSAEHNHQRLHSSSALPSHTAPHSAPTNPWTHPSRAYLATNAPLKSPRGTNPSAPIPTSLPAQVLYFHSPQQRQLYQVTRIPLEHHAPDPPTSPSQHHQNPHLKHPTTQPQNPPLSPTSQASSWNPPQGAPALAPPSSHTHNHRKKYKVTFDIELEEPEWDEKPATESGVTIIAHFLFRRPPNLPLN